MRDSKLFKQQLVYVYFVDKTKYGISTEKAELQRKIEEFNGKLNFLELISLERAVNWINFNINNNK